MRSPIRAGHYRMLPRLHTGLAPRLARLVIATHPTVHTIRTTTLPRIWRPPLPPPLATTTMLILLTRSNRHRMHIHTTSSTSTCRHHRIMPLQLSLSLRDALRTPAWAVSMVPMLQSHLLPTSAFYLARPSPKGWVGRSQRSHPTSQQDSVCRTLAPHWLTRTSIRKRVLIVDAMSCWT